MIFAFHVSFNNCVYIVYVISSFSLASKLAQDAALAYYSAALTFPCTAARALGDEVQEECHLCVVGARAEAALPIDIWAELAIVHSVRKLTIDFTGPAAASDISVQRERHWPSSDNTRVCLRIVEPGLFHESALGTALLTARAMPANMPDAFILFNPGLGSPGWEASWRLTVRALLAARKPLLLTALSVADAARDERLLAAEAIASGLPGWASHGVGGTYVKNPFASLLSACGDGLASDEHEARGLRPREAWVPDGAAPGAANACYRVLRPEGRCDR